MIRIGLLSDTHSEIHPQVFEFFKDVDQLWHAGDIGSIKTVDTLAAFKPTIAVYGNADGYDVRGVLPQWQCFDCENHKVLMTHIGGYPNHYPAAIKQILLKTKPTIFVCGHSHILRIMYDKQFNFLLMNPGAAGRFGFHKIITFVKFVIDGDKIKELEIKEIDR